jgi:F-type H+-transporting ATPase subunit delta
MADKNTIARPYAQAIFEVAQADGALDELSESLAAGKQLLADGQVHTFLSNPSLDDGQRLEFLKGLFAAAAGADSVFAGGSQRGENFLKLLLEYDRVDVLPEIADHFEVLKANVENFIDVTITAATALSEAQKGEIVSALRTRFGRDIVLATEVDENLIGGAVIRAGDVVIDGSLRARLQGLANALVA